MVIFFSESDIYEDPSVRFESKKILQPDPTNMENYLVKTISSCSIDVVYSLLESLRSPRTIFLPYYNNIYMFRREIALKCHSFPFRYFHSRLSSRFGIKGTVLA